MWIFLLLLIWPIFLFLIISIILLPFHFTVYSLINIITIPFQFIKIAFNKNLRGNHALEHATINVLEEKFGYRGLAGLADERGFIIQGPVEPYSLEQAAVSGLRRLQRGEHWLAIHDRCGTSILAANFVFSVIFLYLLWQTGMFNFFNIIIAIILVQVIGPITGKLTQKYITTSARVEDFLIVGVEYRSNVALGLFGLPVRLKPTEFFIRTRRTHHVQIQM